MAQAVDASKERLWLDLVRRWQQSQLTIRAFCQRHRLSEPSFYSWRRVLRQTGLLDEAAAAVDFVPVQVTFAMLSLSLPGRVFLVHLALAGLVQSQLGQDPLAGDLFVFRSKRGDRLKLLYWDQDGLAIWYKRLEEGTNGLPAANAVDNHGSALTGTSQASV